jgi:hypothetical protein
MRPALLSLVAWFSLEIGFQIPVSAAESCGTRQANESAAESCGTRQANEPAPDSLHTNPPRIGPVR